MPVDGLPVNGILGNSGNEGIEEARWLKGYTPVPAAACSGPLARSFYAWASMGGAPTESTTISIISTANTTKALIVT